MDLDLLSLCRTREQFFRFKPHIQSHVLAKESASILAGIESYFKEHPTADSIESWLTFAEWYLTVRSGKIRKETAELLRKWFEKLEGYQLSESGEDVLRHYILADYGTRISEIASRMASGGGDEEDIDKVEELVKAHDAEVGRALSDDDLFSSFDLDDMAAAVTSPGLEWRLEELNVGAGPVRKGDFILVGARPEVGKTTFGAAETSYMAEQLEQAGDHRPICWFNNEEENSKVSFRILQASLGITSAAVLQDRQASQAEFLRLVGSNRFLLPKQDGAMNEVRHIERLLKERRPALIVFDQLDKVQGFGNKENAEHQRLGRLYHWARELAHEYGPVIAFSQVSGGGEGKEFIFMNELRGSTTDKPGEADLIVTIGKVNDPAKKYERYIHLPKNKLFGGPRTDPAQRHGFWTVDIEPMYARYKGKL